MDASVVGRWTRVSTLGRGASGAVVSLAADEATGQLFAVKSAGPAGAAQLRREHGVLSKLRCPHIILCHGLRAAPGGEWQLFLELAPGGSLADEVARSGGRLGECGVGAYAADVLRGLAYLHESSLVHGDVKAGNVLLGADGRAKLADFGCARRFGSAGPLGGTPAFMAPEVARGEEQGPEADVWALGCTVIEMATGRAPWSDMDDALAALHRIGYTKAVPEIPPWLSPAAQDFLGRCLRRDPTERSTAAELLEHPFVAFDVCEAKPEPVKQQRVSPKSALDAEFWESEPEPETDDEEEEMSASPAERIGALACSVSALPDWDSDEGWIEARTTRAPEAETATLEDDPWSGEADSELELFGGSDLVQTVGVADAAMEEESSCDFDFLSDTFVLPTVLDRNEIVQSYVLEKYLCSLFLCMFLAESCSPNLNREKKTAHKTRSILHSIFSELNLVPI